MSVELLKTKDVCAMLKISTKTLYNIRRQDKIFPKPVFHGGGNKYKKNEIEAYIDLLYQSVA